MNLRAALSNYKVTMMWGEELDPRALEILYVKSWRGTTETLNANPYCEELEAAIKKCLNLAVEDFEVLNHGREAIVVRCGQYALRITRGDPSERLVEPELALPRLGLKVVGKYSFEILEIADTGNISAQDVLDMQKKAESLGYVFADAGPDQLGRRANGKLVILDPSALRRSSPGIPILKHQILAPEVKP